MLKLFQSFIVNVLFFRIAHFYEINYDSCSNVSSIFFNGQTLYSLIEAQSDFLIANGFTAGPGQPMAGFFSQSPTTDQERDLFTLVNDNLRGLQLIHDKYVNNFSAKSRPPISEIQRFLTSISPCVDEKYRCTNATPYCDPKYKYRTYDASCNNLKNPNLGTPLTPYGRFLDANYDDSILEVRRSVLDSDLPSPREITNHIFTQEILTKLKQYDVDNLASIFWMQCITHDLADRVPIKHNGNIRDATRCCSSDYKKVLPKDLSHHSCLAFSIPKYDLEYKSTGIQCHNYIRSQRALPTTCEFSPAQQANRVTGYLDLSIIYGTDEEAAMNLRTLNYGKLLTDEDNVLPRGENCRGNRTCYRTGDSRVNQTPMLCILHSLLVRFHNILCDRLLEQNPTWDDEKIYQEARRINVAVYQHITYTQILPTLIGKKFQMSEDTDLYDEDLDGTVTNDYSTGVFRYIHIFVPEHVDFYNSDGEIYSTMDLSETVGRTDLIKNNYDNIVRSLIYQEIYLEGMNEQVRNHLFGKIDLAAIDIQRGRDHGLPSYAKYREFCNLPPVTTFSSLYPTISYEHISLLRGVYRNPQDIDVLIGGAMENKKGKLIGPLFQCIIEKQFDRIKRGDRFFYTRKQCPHPFTEDQLDEIKNYSFEKFLCETTGLDFVPRNSFRVPSNYNYYLRCSDLQQINLEAWKEYTK